MPDPRPAKRRSSPLNKWILLVGGVAVAVWLALFLLINPEKLRDQLAEALHRATGRDVTIAGPVSLSFGLAPSFSAENLSIANAEGGSRPAMLTAKRVIATLSLASLVSGNPAIGAIALDQPDLLIERLPDGTGNWHFTPPRHALYGSSSASSGAGSSSSLALPLTTISATGGQLTWRVSPDHALSVSITTLRIAADGLDAPLSVVLTGTLGGQTIAATGGFGSIDRLINRPLRGLAGPWPVDIKMMAPGAAFNLHGGVTHPDQVRGLDLRVIADADDLTPFNTLIAGALPVPLKKLHLDTRIADGTDGALHSEQFVLTVGASDLSAAINGLAIDGATLSAPGPGQLAQLTINGTYRQDRLRVAGTIMQPDVLSATAPLSISLDASASGATISAHGTIPPSATLGGLDLALAAHVPDLAGLQPLSPVALPAIHDLQFSAHATDAGFRLTGIVLHDIDLQSSAGNLAGDLTLHWLPKLAASGSLSGDHVVLDGLNLLALAAGAPPLPTRAAGVASLSTAPVVLASADAGAPPVSPLPRRLFSDAVLPFARLKMIDLDLDLRADDLTAGGVTWRDAVTHVALTDGRLAINPFRGAAPQGALLGALSIDAAADTPVVALTLRAPAFAASGAATLLGYPGAADGMLQIDARLNGTGASPRLLTATLGGHLGASLVNGQLSGALLQDLLGAALSARGTPPMEDGAVRCFASRLDFTAGIGAVRALALDHTKLSLTGTGQIDLGAETLDLHLATKVKVGGTAVSVPLAARGSFLAPNIDLDPTLDGNRVGFTIGALVEDGGVNPCVEQLTLARDGQPGPMPTVAPISGSAATPGNPKRPTDLLQLLQSIAH